MMIPAVGDVFASKYLIEAIVGRGGMGVVLAARHLELDEPVAIKLILADDDARANNPAFVTRFVREAKLASKIKSEHVVRVLDVARLDTGEPYIVMELLQGRDLSELLAARGPLPVDDVALYVLQACEAIAEAHALGMVHRDLKPANLFVAAGRDGEPCVKVLDFGISKLIDGKEEQLLTKTGTLLGSPLYMSPDQLLLAHDLDARSDVWALGVILFELLTGRRPFDGDDATQVVARILRAKPPTLRSLRPGLPAALDELVQLTLAKERDERIPDVAELSRRLAPFAPLAARASVAKIANVLQRWDSLAAAAPSRPSLRTADTLSDTPVVATLGPASGPLHAHEARRVRQRSRTLLLLVALGAALASFGAWHALQPSTDATAVSQPPSSSVVAPAPAVVAPSPLALPSQARADAGAVGASASAPAPAASSPSAPALRPKTKARRALVADPFGGVR